MFSRAVKVNIYRRLMQTHETTPEFSRSNAVGLDIHVQRKLFETTPTASRREKRIFDEMMTSHRYEDILDQLIRLKRQERITKLFIYHLETRFALQNGSTRNNAHRIRCLECLRNQKQKSYKTSVK
jgi:hypothetical protein